jgi:hypothetical protein
VFDADSFTYVLPYTLTGFVFCEAGTRDAALKALRELHALHSWDVHVDTYGLLPADVVAKGLDIRSSAHNSLPPDEDRTFIEIALRVIHRPMGRGKLVSDDLRVKLNDEYLETVFEVLPIYSSPLPQGSECRVPTLSLGTTSTIE